MKTINAIISWRNLDSKYCEVIRKILLDVLQLFSTSSSTGKEKLFSIAHMYFFNQIILDLQ